MKNRHPLRKKEKKRLQKELEEQLGIELIPIQTGMVESALSEDLELIIVDNIIFAIIFDSKPFLTIRGFLALGDSLPRVKKFVTVDKGAVKFVYNGADVMAPGIVEVDPEISQGDLVWIRDETHKKPLAVGEALMDAQDISNAKSGKAVKSLHHIGDRIWSLEV